MPAECPPSRVPSLLLETRPGGPVEDRGAGAPGSRPEALPAGPQSCYEEDHRNNMRKTRSIQKKIFKSSGKITRRKRSSVPKSCKKKKTKLVNLTAPFENSPMLLGSSLGKNKQTEESPRDVCPVSLLHKHRSPIFLTSAQGEVNALKV